MASRRQTALERSIAEIDAQRAAAISSLEERAKQYALTVRVSGNRAVRIAYTREERRIATERYRQIAKETFEEIGSEAAFPANKVVRCLVTERGCNIFSTHLVQC